MVLFVPNESVQTGFLILNCILKIDAKLFGVTLLMVVLKTISYKCNIGSLIISLWNIFMILNSICLPLFCTLTSWQTVD